MTHQTLSSSNGTDRCNTTPRHFSGFTHCYVKDKSCVPAQLWGGKSKRKRLEAILARADDRRQGQTTEFPWGFWGLRMVRIVPEEGVKERFARWFLAAAARLDRNKHGVNLRQLLGVVESHHPPPIGLIVHI